MSHESIADLKYRGRDNLESNVVRAIWDFLRRQDNLIRMETAVRLDRTPNGGAVGPAHLRVRNQYKPSNRQADDRAHGAPDNAGAGLRDRAKEPAHYPPLLVQCG